MIHKNRVVANKRRQTFPSICYQHSPGSKGLDTKIGYEGVARAGFKSPNSQVTLLVRPDAYICGGIFKRSTHLDEVPDIKAYRCIKQKRIKGILCPVENDRYAHGIPLIGGEACPDCRINHL